MRAPRLKHIGKRFGIARRGMQVFFYDNSAKKGSQVEMMNAPRARQLVDEFVRLASDPAAQIERLGDKAVLNELIERAVMRVGPAV